VLELDLKLSADQALAECQRREVHPLREGDWAPGLARELAALPAR
jgi:hypothetical protein